ncbi:MAG: GAF domain-containing protein, partial [Leptospiraceae bacterium]|nr:GAF domain-containing protein [Leptospiraceae bacterium]
IELSKSNIAYQNGLEYSNIALNYLEKLQTKPKELEFSLKESHGWFLYILGKFDEGEKVYKELLKSCDDRIIFTRLNVFRIGQFGGQARIFDSVNLRLEVLEKLDVLIPTTEEDRGALFLTEYQKILAYLESNSVESLLGLEKMTDRRQILIQEVLSRLLIPTILSAQITLLGILTCKSINLVIENGNIDLVSYAFALFAVTIISINNDYQKGVEFGEIAIELSQKNNNKSLMGGVFNTVACLTNHLKYPAFQNEDLFFKSEKFCEESGNIFEMVLSGGNVLWNKFYRGDKLENIYSYCNEYYELCNKYSLWEAMINIYFPTMGIINYLTGRQTSGDLLQYDNRTENEHVEIVEKMGSKSPLAQFYGILITKAFIFGDYKSILKNGELLEKNTAAPTVFHDICPNFYRCVAYLLLLKELEGEEKKKILEKVETLKETFRIYSELSENNFYHMYELILAVESMSKNDHWKTLELFDSSISSALENNYIQNAAIGYELAGNYFKNKNKTKIYETYINEAYKLYNLWGAKLKVLDLEKKHKWILRNRNTIHHSISKSIGIHSGSTNNLEIDFTSTLKAADLILTEIKIDSLTDKIVKVILENSGASEASLIIKKNNTFIIYCHGINEEEIKTNIITLPVDLYKNISHSIVNFVLHSKQRKIINNAYREPEYLSDLYIQNKKIQSILCQPIVHTGEIIGAIYLESDSTSNIFSSDRTETINLISSLAGISIQNALFYESLDEKVIERTEELNSANLKLLKTNSLLEKALSDLKNTQKQLIHSEKMAVLGNLIAGIAHEM